MGQKIKPIKHGKTGKKIGYSFYCPGCKTTHVYYTREIHPGSPVWSFNGNMEKPTFVNSLLVNEDISCPSVPRCHMWMTDGEIQYLDDCTHKLAGKTITMEDIDQLSND